MTESVTNRFLAQIVPENMTLCLAKERSFPATGRPKLHFQNMFFSPDADAALAKEIRKALRDTDTNYYFAIGGYNKNKRRRATDVLGVKVLLLDIDLKPDPKYFDTKAEAIAGLKTLHTACPLLPAPWLVDSGNGIHVYYALDEVLTTAKWSPLASLFASVVKAVEPKLIADPVRTRDAASVMRLPGSWNAKSIDRLPVTNPRQGNPQSVDIVRQTLASAAAKYNVSGVDDVIGNELVPNLPVLPSYMNVDADVSFGEGMNNPQRELFTDLDLRPIIKGCKQMREICMTKGNVPEPQWVNFLRVLNTVKNSDDVACHFSSGHPSYSEAGTRRKMRHIRANFETATCGCEEFKNINPSGCYGCPHSKTVWTPSQLAVVSAQNTEAKAAKEEAREIAVSGVVTPQGYIPQDATVKQRRTPGGHHEVTYLPVRQAGKNAVLEHEEVISGHVHVAHSTAMVTNKVVNRRERESHSDVRVHLDVVTRGMTNRVVVATEALTGSSYDAVTSELRKGGLVFDSTYLNQKNSIMIYLHELVRLSANTRKLYRERKGWLKTGDVGNWQFVAGARTYKADGTVEDNVTSAEHFGDAAETEGFMERNCSGIPTGHMRHWKLGMDIYNGKKMAVAQLLLLSGMANLLMPLLDSAKGGIVLSITGEAGKGKTTLLDFMCSFMGNHKRYVVPGSSTTNALGALMQQANCMMLPVDDTVSENAEAFSDLLSMVTGGNEKMRMIWSSTGGKTPYKDGFYTSILLSSNKSTTAQIGTGGAGRSQLQAEAARSRTLEFPSTLIKAPPHVSNADWMKAASLISSNHGWAADKFLRYVAENQVTVSNQVNKLEGVIYDRISKIVDIHKGATCRFWARFLAVVAVTARIVCHNLNLLDWDHAEILAAGERLVGETVAHAASADDDLVENFWSCVLDEPNPSVPKINFVTRTGQERHMGDWRTETRTNRMHHSDWSEGTFMPTGQVNGHAADMMLPKANEENRWRVDVFDIETSGKVVIRRERVVYMPINELIALVKREAGNRLAVADWADLYTRLCNSGCVIDGLAPGRPYSLSERKVRIRLGLSKRTHIDTPKSVVEIRLPPLDVS